jgi:hypothetical protein
MAKILQYPELRVNPFGDRICCIFSSSHDGDCTFEDFLDMMSVFSDGAPKAVKAEHAFRIFGKHTSINSFHCCHSDCIFNLVSYIVGLGVMPPLY